MERTGPTPLDNVRPKHVPALDPGFVPAALFNRAYRQAAEAAPGAAPVGIAVEQADGGVFRFQTRLLPAGHPAAVWNNRYLERFVKFLLWSRGGFRVTVAAPPAVVDALSRHYAETDTGRFDADIMGRRIYGRAFEILCAGSESDLPPAHEARRALGRHTDGCRLGFDLGASDIKIAAVMDGHPVFSEEYPWDPVPQTDPQWHFDRIQDALKQGAQHLPRVDAIGGSAAGVYVENRVRVASLFRGVPANLFESRVKGLFLQIRYAWGGIPFEVVNDGEVTALAGSMATGDHSVLGVAMGSSEAAGYVTPEGAITTWLNELAFAPVDVRADAPADEWSGDRGCGVQYLSQQAVGRLVRAAGLEPPPGLKLPEILKLTQERMARGDPRAAAIYRTLGVYFGYAVAHYADFYAIRHILALGRVLTGDGGALLVGEAESVLKEEFPELAEGIRIRQPGEKEKRVGQAIAAASLPRIGN